MLYVKKSKLPRSGFGLFTTKLIRRGEIVCEYKGEWLTWKKCLKRNEKMNDIGGYYFYVSADKCVDAQHTTWELARYANDAVGFSRIDGLRNNSKYEVRKGIPYIVTTRNIPEGDEIFVSYGKEYWDVMKKHYSEKSLSKKKNATPH